MTDLQLESLPQEGRPAEELIGELIDGKYRLLRKLGSGGMGTVYEARHERLSRRCAIKVLSHDLQRDERFRRRFQREAEVLGTIEHENIVAVWDVGRHRDHPYLVMECLNGRTLREQLLDGAPLSFGFALDIALQTARGLEHAHARKVVHRDLKPDNLMLCRRADGEVLVKILDFGIASLAATDQSWTTTTGAGLGTPHYMSPEQARGAKHVDARTDVHALGVVLYEMLSAELPYQGESRNEVLYHVMSQPAVPLAARRPELSDCMLRLVEKAIAKTPEERYADGSEIANALRMLSSKRESALLVKEHATLTGSLPATETPSAVAVPQPRVDARDRRTESKFGGAAIGAVAGALLTSALYFWNGTDTDAAKASVSDGDDRKPAHAVKLDVASLEERPDGAKDDAKATVVPSAAAGPSATVVPAPEKPPLGSVTKPAQGKTPKSTAKPGGTQPTQTRPIEPAPPKQTVPPTEKQPQFLPSPYEF